MKKYSWIGIGILAGTALSYWGLKSLAPPSVQLEATPAAQSLDQWDRREQEKLFSAMDTLVSPVRMIARNSGPIAPTLSDHDIRLSQDSEQALSELRRHLTTVGFSEPEARFRWLHAAADSPIGKPELVKLVQSELQDFQSLIEDPAAQALYLDRLVYLYVEKLPGGASREKIADLLERLRDSHLKLNATDAVLAMHPEARSEANELLAAYQIHRNELGTERAPAGEEP